MLQTNARIHHTLDCHVVLAIKQIQFCKGLHNQVRAHTYTVIKVTADFTAVLLLVDNLCMSPLSTANPQQQNTEICECCKFSEVKLSISSLNECLSHELPELN